MEITTETTLGEFLSVGDKLKPVDVSEEFRVQLTATRAVAVILAAGKGSRFHSEVPKVIYPCNGIPMAAHALKAATEAGLPSVLVVGHDKERVLEALRPYYGPTTVVAEDTYQIGTGHAVYVARAALPNGFDGDIVVTYGDNPGINATTLRALLDFHRDRAQSSEKRFGASILTGSRSCVSSKASGGYGRIIRSASGEVIDIVEKKQINRMPDGGSRTFPGGLSMTKAELDGVDEFNSGIVAARCSEYLDVLSAVTAAQTASEPAPKFEFYATDFVKGMRLLNIAVDGWLVDQADTWRLEGANTVPELESLVKKMESSSGKFGLK